jgi:hypothetical protein
MVGMCLLRGDLDDQRSNWNSILPQMNLKIHRIMALLQARQKNEDDARLGWILKSCRMQWPTVKVVGRDMKQGIAQQ